MRNDLVTSIADLLNSAEAPDWWLFPERVSHGLWFVEGGEMGQRSTLMMQIGIAVARGKNLFSEGAEVTPRNVVYFSYARSRDGVAAGFRKLNLNPQSLKKELLIGTAERVTLDDLDPFVAELVDGDVILIDGVPIDGIPEDLKVGTWLEMIVFSLKRRFTVILSPTMEMRGKKRDVAASLADGFIELKPNGESQEIIVSGRSVDQSNLLYDGANWVPVAFSGATMDQLEIVDLLKKSPGTPLKLANIAEELGVKADEKFRKRMQRLVGRGVIERAGQGMYQYHAEPKAIEGR